MLCSFPFLLLCGAIAGLLGGIVGWLLRNGLISDLRMKLKQKEQDWLKLNGQYSALNQNHDVLQNQHNTLRGDYKGLEGQFDEYKTAAEHRATEAETKYTTLYGDYDALQVSQ